MQISQTFNQQLSQYTVIVNDYFLYSYTGKGLLKFSLNQQTQQIEQESEYYENILYENMQKFAIDQQNLIIFQALNTLGYKALNIQDMNNPQIITSDPFQGTYGVVNIITHPFDNVIFIQTMWDRITAINFDQYYGAQQYLDFYTSGIYIDETYSLKTDLLLSSDGNFLFFTQVGSGIVILDVQDINKMYIYQIIEVNGSLSKIFLTNGDHQSIYVNASKNIYKFERSYPQQIDFNLFTRAHSVKWEDPGNEVWPWQQLFTHDNTRFYLCGGVDGLRIFDSSNLPQLNLINTITDQDIPLFNQIFTIIAKQDNENIVIVGTYQENAIFVLDCTDIQNPQLLGSLKIPGQIVQDLKIFNVDPNKIIANSQSDIFILDISEISQPTIISQLEDQFQIIKEGAGESFLSLSPDQQYVFGCSGTLDLVYIAHILQDFTQITTKNSIYVEYPFFVLTSKIHEGIVYSQGNTGNFYILNIDYSSLEFSYKSTLQLEGTMFQITTNQIETLVFITSTIKYELLTVNISDLSNPTLIHIFQQPGEHAFFSILVQSQQGKFLIINLLNGGLRVIPTQLNSQLNVEFYKLQDYKLIQNIKEKDQNYTIFQVGEECQIYVSNLVNPNKKRIAEFYYYDVEQSDSKQIIHEEIKFDLTKKTINFKATQHLIGFNTILVEIQNQVFVDDIYQALQEQITEPLIIDGQTISLQEQAEYLYSQSQKYGYINQEGFPTDSVLLDLTVTMVINTQYIKQLDVLHKVLTLKKDLYPVNFRILKSLYFYPQYKQIDPENNQYIIETYTENLDLILSISNIHGTFFEQEFQGLVVSYSGTFDHITLSGKLGQINNQINKIKLHLNNPNDLNNIPVQVEINDSLNEDFQQTYKFSELKFLQINQSVVLQEKLQKQVDFFYPEAKLFVQEQFQFQFNENTFQDDDQLKYKLFLILEEEEIEITQQYNYLECWFNFDFTQRTLKGMCQLSMINSVFNFRIEASDGFTFASDEITFKFSKLPALVIIYYVFMGMSGAFTVIGLFRYRGKFYRMVCKSKYQAGQYYIAKDKHFLFQIILDQEDYRLVKQHFQVLKKQLKQRQLNYIDLLQNPQNSRNMVVDRILISNILQKNFKNFDSLGYASEQSYQYVTMQGFIFNEISKMSQFIQEKQIIQDMKQFSVEKYEHHKEQWYQHFVDVEPIIVTDNYDYAPRIVYRMEQIFESFLIILSKKKYIKNFKQNKVKRNSIKQPASIEISSTDDNFIQIVEEYQQKYPDINIYLILQLLKMHAVGVIKDQYFKYQYGQSITTIKQKIHVIKAQKRRGSKYDHILKYINYDYMNIPFSQNAPLPSWCEYKFLNNILEIYGCYPSVLSKQEQKYGFLIRIDDDSGKTLKQFELIQVDLPENSNQEIKNFASSTKRIVGLSQDQSMAIQKINQSSFNQSYSQFNSQSPKKNLDGKYNFQEDAIVQDYQTITPSKFFNKKSTDFMSEIQSIIDPKKAIQKDVFTESLKTNIKNTEETKNQKELKVECIQLKDNKNDKNHESIKNQSKNTVNSNNLLEDSVQEEFNNQNSQDFNNFNSKYQSEVNTLRGAQNSTARLASKNFI